MPVSRPPHCFARCLLAGTLTDADPGNFGNIAVSMLSLFQVANTASWASFAYIAMYGCDSFLGGHYDGSRVPESDLVPNPNEGVVHRYEMQYEQTRFGKYPLWYCT